MGCWEGLKPSHRLVSGPAVSLKLGGLACLQRHCLQVSSRGTLGPQACAGTVVESDWSPLLGPLQYLQSDWGACSRDSWTAARGCVPITQDSGGARLLLGSLAVMLVTGPSQKCGSRILRGRGISGSVAVSRLDAGPPLSNGSAQPRTAPRCHNLLPGCQSSHRALLSEDGCWICCSGEQERGNLRFRHLA